MRVEHKTCSTIRRTPLQAILDPKNLTGLAGGVREGQNFAPNGPRFLASEPSRGPKMCPGPRKWTQINQGQLGGLFGVLKVLKMN